MTPIVVKHAETKDVADDPKHPIPSLSVVDVNVIKKSGGANLSIVVASPLMADERSQTRLLDKIEGYLRFLKTAAFQDEAGPPTPENTFIVVQINTESEPLIFDLLERSKGWVRENGATLQVKRLGLEGGGDN